MANEIRMRQGGIGGLIEDNPLTASATLLTSAGLAAVAGGVDSSHHLALVADPDGIAGPPEIMYVTNLTAGNGATGSTGLARGQEGTTARQHDQDTHWLHTVTPRDFQRQVQKIDVTTTNSTTASNTYVDLDATNLPALGLYAYVGDLVQWELTGTWQSAGNGNPLSVDALITLPDASTTTFRATGSKGAAMTWEPVTNAGDAITLTARGLYVATQTGTVTFKPQWHTSGGVTATLRRDSTYGSNPTHLIRNFGPPAD